MDALARWEEAAEELIEEIGRWRALYEPCWMLHVDVGLVRS
jgi:hypothetical protein